MDRRVLITGGTGNLGSSLRQRLLNQGHRVRIMSRREPRGGEREGVEWAVADIGSGKGVPEAVAGVDVIVHAASSPFPRSLERDGARHLIGAALEADIAHFMYMSIVGIEEIDFSYYQSKLTVERMLEEAGLPLSVLRATQFHRFVEQILEGLARLPIILLPRGWRFRPISAGDVADRLVMAIQEGPGGRLPSLGGPEILTLDRMLAEWKSAKDVHKPVLRIPVPGGLSRGFREGHNLHSEVEVDGLRWQDYLRGQDDPVHRKAHEAGGVA